MQKSGNVRLRGRVLGWISLVAAVVLLLYVLVACVPGTAYRITDDDQVLEPLPGLAAFLNEAGAAGVPLHVIFVHGMGHGSVPGNDDDAGTSSRCAGPEEHGLYASTLHAIAPPLLDRLGAPAACPTIARSSRDGGVRTYTSAPVEVDANRRVVFHELNFVEYFAFDSDSLNPYRDVTGLFDDDKRRLVTDDRLLLDTALNHYAAVKTQLVSWGLADAATYLDPAKRSIIVRDMTNAMMGIVEASEVPYLPGHHTVFITKSLGSKVLFDTLAWMYGVRYEPIPLVTGGGLPPLFPNTRAVYMLANQLPLLELGTSVDRTFLEPPAEGVDFPAGPIDDETPAVHFPWFEVLRGERPRLELSRPRIDHSLYLIAISDPNDFLTFRIAPTIARYVPIPEPTEHGVAFRLVAADLVVPVGRNWLNVFVHPVVAHAGHLENERVVSILVDGWTD